MKVRRFVAGDMQEAMYKVKAVLGKDAIILNTRKFKEGGFLGFFGRDMVEVTAAVDHDILPKKSQYLPQIEGSHTKVFQTELMTEAFRKHKDLEKDEKDFSLKKELIEVKGLLENMAGKLEEGHSQKRIYPQGAEKILKVLLSREVEENLAHHFVQEALNKLEPFCWQDEEAIQQYVSQSIVSHLSKPKPILFTKNADKKRIALVGPTGVGKTTTIAKLAAIFTILEKRKVALITIDTYRVAAVEQLRTYAEIIDIPLEVVYAPCDLQEAFIKHEDKELILIDTAGRSPLNKKQITELKNFLELPTGLDVFLVLGATTKQSDLWETVRRFNELPVSSLIFTKLDETLNYGAILNVVNKVQKPVSYVTTGQNVPDDIETLDPYKIAEIILRGRD